ncbi:MAG: DUF2764 family protein [Candidatus Omnitrophota bacterium]
MQNKYYYLVASLPFLKFAQEPPISKSVFLAECEKWLAPEDMRAVLSMDLTSWDVRGEDTAVIRQWKNFDRALKEDLSHIRAAKKSHEDYRAPEALRGVTELETPLAMEQALEKIRWDFLEEKSAGYFFDVNGLALYFLKLQILQRLAGFDKDRGESTFYQLCEVIYEQAVG